MQSSAESSYVLRQLDRSNAVARQQYHCVARPTHRGSTRPRVTVPAARILQIKPWDKTAIKDIERALHEANLGVSPQNDGEVIRLIFPPTTEERRREFVKEAWGQIENGKVSIRNKRRDGNDMLKELEKEGEISEDELKRGLARVQELTDSNTKALDELGKSKEEEILTV